jgi:hypothetical protein
MQVTQLKSRGLVVLLAMLWCGAALAAPPKWVSSLRGVAIPEYPPETDFVTLFSEVQTSVKANGRIESKYRFAYKILTVEGKARALLNLYYSGDTKISKLKAWNLKPGNIVHKASQKNAVESQSFGIFFGDNKSLRLLVPQTDVGSIVAYEYRQRRRPYILQDTWTFQDSSPVLRSRFVLELPQGWSHRQQLLHHPGLVPLQESENRWVWELEELEAIPDEQGMPPTASLAATLAVAYVPDEPVSTGTAFESWDDVASWMTGLMAPRLLSTPAIREMADQLGDRQAMAEFAQKQIRYVAIAIGIGGHQPHAADEILDNRYGDCKDKVTLLKSLLDGQGTDVRPVLINTDGRGVEVDFPTPYFNHMIAAIPMAADEPTTAAVMEHPQLGRLLLFDPTDHYTPLGQLPTALQGTQALLIDGDSGYVIETPVAPAASNGIERTGSFQVFADGHLEGEVTEFYQGVARVSERRWLLNRTHDQWMQGVERYVARWLPGAAIREFRMTRSRITGDLTERYSLIAPAFAQLAGELMLIRPCVLSSKFYDLKARKERQFPFEFSHLRTERDSFEITTPVGFTIEQLPDPVHLDLPFARYRSSVTQEGNILKYDRSLEITRMSVPKEEVVALRDFYRSVDRGERDVVILRRHTGESDSGEGG